MPMITCLAIMANGNACGRLALVGTNYCGYHKSLRINIKKTKSVAAPAKKAAAMKAPSKAGKKNIIPPQKKAVAKKSATTKASPKKLAGKKR